MHYSDLSYTKVWGWGGVWVLPSFLHSSRDVPEDKFRKDFHGSGAELKANKLLE